MCQLEPLSREDSMLADKLFRVADVIMVRVSPLKLGYVVIKSVSSNNTQIKMRLNSRITGGKNNKSSNRCELSNLAVRHHTN